MKYVRHLSLCLSLLSASAAFAQLVPQGGETQVTYSGSTAIILQNTPVNNLLLTSGVNTFLLGVTPPTNAVRIYIVNDTANPCNNLTVSIASTGNTTLTSFNNAPQAWQSISASTPGGALASSSPITLPASATVAVTSSPIIGSKIAIFIVASAACATTNIDVQAVFGTFSPSTSAVTGTVAPGGNGSTVSPVLVGGLDVNGNVRTVNTGPGFTNHVQGLGIGGSSVGVGATFSAEMMPGGTADGPLSVFLNAGGISGTIPLKATNTACTATQSCPGLYVADSGFLNSVSTAFSSTGQAVSLWSPVTGGNAVNGQVMTCHFDAVSVNTGGTSPTMDIYVQDSVDGVNWNDRLHFAQATTGTLRQAAGIAGTSVNMPVTAYTSRTIAASTIVNGPLGPWGQFVVVMGGTTPSYNVTFSANCK